MIQPVTFEVDKDGPASWLLITGADWAEWWPLNAWSAMLTYFRWEAEHGVTDMRARCDGLAEQCEAWRAKHPEGFEA